MSLEDRCRFDEAGNVVVTREASTKTAGFLYREVSLKSPAGREPNFNAGKWGEPVKMTQRVSVLEIKDGEEICILTPNTLRRNIKIKYKITEKKNVCELCFPEGSSAIDLSRVQLLDPTGIRYFLGSGDITKGMSFFLPEEAQVGTRPGYWHLVTDGHGKEAVEFKS